MERTDKYKPPEAQTYAERFASAPIYGSAHGLPYDETQSVFNQPDPVLKSGTKRSSSVSRSDSETSKYLSSLAPKEPFRKQDADLFRKSSFPDAQRTSRSILKKEPSLEDKIDSEISSALKRFDDKVGRKTSLPPLSPRTEQRSVVFKHETGGKGQPVVKKEETTISSLSSSLTSGSSAASKPPVSLRYRRASFGSTGSSQIPSSMFENTQKWSSQHNIYQETNRDDPPRFRSAQHFREARRKADEELLSDKIKKTFDVMKIPRHFESSSDGKSYSRSRASSVEPFPDDNAFTPRPRLNSFSSKLRR